MTPKVICFFTPGYAEAARGLQESGREFGVQVHATPFPDAGSHTQNCLLKPRFVRNQLESLQEDASLLYLDADARFVDHPDWSEFENADLAAHVLENGNPIGGAIFMRNTSECRRLIDRWVTLAEAVPPKRFLDEYTLKRVLAECPSRLLKTHIPRWSFCGLLRNQFSGVRPTLVHDMIGTRARLSRR